MQINRGEIWSVAWTNFARKPRPALVIQAEEYRLTEGYTCTDYYDQK